MEHKMIEMQTIQSQILVALDSLAEFPTENKSISKTNTEKFEISFNHQRSPLKTDDAVVTDKS